jgi:16S rRNA (uracil1498-N3)-methyltransferase
VAHVFVADVTSPELTLDDARHLGRVLRVRTGEIVSVADGTGGWCTAAFDGGVLRPLAEAARVAPMTPSITVAMAVSKGDRPEWAVQKLTEVGVDRIIPLTAARSIVRWDTSRVERVLGRWRSIAHQSAMQSRRLQVPVIEEPASVAELAARHDLVAAMAEPGAAAPTLARPAMLIGPEGGWSPEELASGLPTVGLVPTVLRSETAAVVAGTLLAAIRAGTVRPCVT